MGNRVAGIAATVIGALLIWWMTSDGGLLNRKRPDVKILSAEVRCPLIAAGAGSSAARFMMARRADVTVDVVNEGKASALQCRVEWNGLSPVASEGASVTSSEFGLKATGTTTVELRGMRAGFSNDPVDTTLTVTCGNARSVPHRARVPSCRAGPL